MDVRQFDFVGGSLCLDFANTVNRPGGTIRAEHMRAYGDLLSWSLQAGTVDGVEAARLTVSAGEDVRQAEQVLERARRLRDAIYRIFATLGGGAVADEDLEVVNVEIGRALAHARLQPTGEGFRLECCRRSGLLERPLWPVAQSAAELLTAPEAALVHECAAPSCTYLFLDCSRNHRRRWCDMKVCGNRAKARRHRVRRKKAAGPER